MKMIFPAAAALCMLLLGTAGHARDAAGTVTVYTSANVAPLRLPGGRGMYADLVAQLNRQQAGGPGYRLVYLPRKRLQARLEAGSLDGVVIGMMPEWLGDAQQKKYLWTVPFAYDRFVLVSRAAAPVGPQAPDGVTIGVTLGYVYPGLDAWLLKRRALLSNGASDANNLEKLLLGRLDCVLVGEMVARFFVKSHAGSVRLHIAALPGPGNERRFLAPHSRAATFEKLAPAVLRLRDQQAWRRAAAAYNHEEVAR